jgi:hypothetical protein
MILYGPYLNEYSELEKVMVCPITTIWWIIRWGIEIKKNGVS